MRDTKHSHEDFRKEVHFVDATFLSIRRGTTAKG
jgi:hypothetical protein